MKFKIKLFFGIKILKMIICCHPFDPSTNRIGLAFLEEKETGLMIIWGMLLLLLLANHSRNILNSAFHVSHGVKNNLCTKLYCVLSIL